MTLSNMPEFSEIAHSGGTITFNFETDESPRVSWRLFGLSHASTVEA
ncbi:MAG: hypothetical protein H0W47_04775 [Polaromonas sp.]|nr:hypothetical protein [Polaromonas sp.]MBA3593098.1 hypothetical protein [Polaromonas sp.]